MLSALQMHVETKKSFLECGRSVLSKLRDASTWKFHSVLKGHRVSHLTSHLTNRTQNFFFSKFLMHYFNRTHPHERLSRSVHITC